MMVFDDLEQEIVFCLAYCEKKKYSSDREKKLRSLEQLIPTAKVFETEYFFNLPQC